MFRLNIFLFGLLAFCASIFSASSFADSSMAVINDRDNDSSFHEIMPLPIVRCQLDPAVTKINFSIIRKYSQFRGKVQIAATIQNIGTIGYVSAPNQQSILLYEGDRLVARKKFQNLRPREMVTISYQRDWNASSPNEGEFPPMYKAMIIYDPDILMDNNKLNDDCNARNNQLSRSGMDINRLF
ncbi:MAG: hypothetical protein HQK53_11225 [Oligoflexia bacterium]|nr:hypothetical protein [Oligoflexia bacterium]